jgi:tetratricopeptide (TPR) repeat protein
MSRSIFPLLVRLFSSLLAGLFAQNLSAATSTEIYARASQAVLVLEGRDAKGKPQVQATATALGDGQAVTHCDLLNSAEKWVVIQGQRDFVAYPREHDEARNLCRLDVPGLQVAKPEIVPLEQVRVGQRVYAIGNALGLGLSLSEGLVSGIRDMDGESWIQTTAALAPGSEGGALFDDQGRLLGLTDYRKRDGQNVNFAAPAAWLTEIVNRAGQSDSTGKLHTEATRLNQARDWKGLAELAADWSRRQPKQGEPWIWLGVAQNSLKDYQSAADAFEKALARTPGSISISLALAGNRILLKQPGKALEVVRSALESHQEDASLWFAKGSVELALEHADLAEQAFQETVRLDSQHEMAWVHLFDAAFNRGDYRTAQQYASHLTEIDPARGDYWMRLAQAYLRQGRPARATQAIQRANTITPGNGEVLMLLGIIQATLNQPGQAIATYKQSLAAKPLQPAWVWHRLGNAYYQVNLYPEAIAALREAVRLDPDQLSHQSELGIMLKDDGQDEEALKLFQTLCGKIPKDPLPWRQVGFIQANLGNYNQAIASLEQSLRLSPDQQQVWHVLGQVYAMTGQPTEVRRVYQRLRGIDPMRAEQLYSAYLQPLEAQP